ncbi:cell wall-binding repeat-containing protein [Curtobacterium sp. RRHDQ10]|uniref:cell wall-binding repeat-containing protein n=1 Tax=Curtobacterium phyllosphaerae TaxID=3413379 RepID=UPI003BF26BEE
MDCGRRTGAVCTPDGQWVRFHLVLSHRFSERSRWASAHPRRRRSVHSRRGAGLGAAASPHATRLDGDDRYGTAVAVSRWAWSTTVPTVYLASGESFPDALSAGPAAAHAGGPLLLTPRSGLPAVVADEIRRLAPRAVVVVGGPAAVSDDVLRQVRAIGPDVVRVSGSDRYATSREVFAHEFTGFCDRFFVATGRNWPDALALGRLSAAGKDPLLLVDGSAPGIDAATSQFLDRSGCETFEIGGGVNAVSAGVEADLQHRTPSVRRIAGADRYETAVATNNLLTVGKRIFVVSAANFPDALAASAEAGYIGSGLVLVTPQDIPTATRNFLSEQDPEEVMLVGGPSAVGWSIENQLRCGSSLC